MKIEVRSVPHRKVSVADILPNPHRDLKLNPTSVERVGQLLESIERTGFWDNIVVREHPSRDGKYELAYGHNRLAALKDRKIEVDTVTIPVAKLTDWEMYCAMVDENELQGGLTPAIAMENIGVGCDLIEKALKNIGPEGTWEQFNQEIGRSVPAGTEVRAAHDGGFEKVRNAFHDGNGIGRGFLIDFLPCGHIRKDTISTVLADRYAETRAAAAKKKAAEAEAKAKEKREHAKVEADAKKRKALEDAADEDDAAAKRLGQQANKLKEVVGKKVLLMFDTPKAMTDFAAAIRKLSIPVKYHEAAAEKVLTAKVKDERIERELSVWWDEVSGESARRREIAKRDAEQAKMRKAMQGEDPVKFLLQLGKDLQKTETRINRALDYTHLFDAHCHRVIRDEIAPLAELLNELVERSRATLGSLRDITPAKPKMLSHRR